MQSQTTEPTEENTCYTAGGQPLPDATTLIADAAFMARFRSKVNEGKPRQCWEWQGAREEKGYGKFRINQLMLAAHRVAFMIGNGRWPSANMMLLHSCDNPRCCNPSHLREGSARENNQETVAKGHHSNGAKARRNGINDWREGKPSERILRGSSPLSEYDVRQIRARHRDGETISALATSYEVPEQTIRNSITGQTFLWVVGEGEALANYGNKDIHVASSAQGEDDPW